MKLKQSSPNNCRGRPHLQPDERGAPVGGVHDKSDWMTGIEPNSAGVHGVDSNAPKTSRLGWREILRQTEPFVHGPTRGIGIHGDRKNMRKRL
ncbi:hypothetical protein CEXT_444711 [Caerostris extrusa]|uniref:Uncharacterized protein n=1 Tax=Caerostris extrusa TaxID=172846 RepID=A0AAV4ULI3_CAEEX|nr:hypothetical protein CEXT_444711 [Caerostris extrusa]